MIELEYPYNVTSNELVDLGIHSTSQEANITKRETLRNYIILRGRT